jgi:GT2 family glycosyltransferase
MTVYAPHPDGVVPTESHGIPAVSVIIPAFNVAHFLGEALQSVKNQRFANYEVIVVDDGSPDDVASVCRPFLSDPRFSMVRIDNSGLSGARNHGISLARAPLVALLDGDDLYRPGYLEKMVAKMAEFPDAAFVTCDAISFGAGNDGERFSSRYPQDEPITLLRLLQKDVAVFGLCTVRTDMIRAVGGYDQSLRSSEDLDLWLRLLATGATGRLVAEPLVDYRRHAASLSSNRARLMQTTAVVYQKAADALAGRPEAALAEALRDEAQAISRFETGVDWVLAGKRRAGVREMRLSGHKADNRKWQIALFLFSLVPLLAGPALALYRHGNNTTKIS